MESLIFIECNNGRCSGHLGAPNLIDGVNYRLIHAGISPSSVLALVPAITTEFVKTHLPEVAGRIVLEDVIVTMPDNSIEIATVISPDPKDRTPERLIFAELSPKISDALKQSSQSTSRNEA